MKMFPVLCLLIAGYSANAQNKNFTGFYITNDGDTVHGSYPKYSQWNNNPDKIEFTIANSTTIQLTPFNSKKIVIDNYDEYISYSGKRLLNPIEDNVAIDNRGYFDYRDRDTLITVFLRLVTRTPQCDIYVLTDKIRTNFFYKTPDQSIQELRFKKYFDDTNMHEIGEYRQQLSNLFADDIAKKNLNKALEDLPYTEDQIETFITKLFIGKRTSEAKKQAKENWIVAAGASVNFMKLKGSLVNESGSNYKTSVAPSISFGYLVPINRNFNRYFFYPQLRFYNYKSTEEFISGSFKHRIVFKSPLMISPQLNLGVNILNKENSKLFVYGGGGMLFMVKNTKTEQKINPSNGSLYSSYDIRIARLVHNLNVSAGLQVKAKFLLLATYNFPVDVGNFQLYSSLHSSVQIGIGYKF